MYRKSSVINDERRIDVAEEGALFRYSSLGVADQVIKPIYYIEK